MPEPMSKTRVASSEDAADILHARPCQVPSWSGAEEITR